MPDAFTYATCAHEARHTVAAWRCGMEILRVGLVGRSGYCEYVEPEIIGELWTTGRPLRAATLDELRPAVEGCMLVLLAGISGEVHGPADPGCARDLAQAQQLWDQWRQVNTAWIPPIHEVLPHYCATARLLLADHQAQVLRVSAALLSRRVLDYTAVQHLLGKRPRMGR